MFSPAPSPPPPPPNSNCGFKKKTLSKRFGQNFRSKRFGQNVSVKTFGQNVSVKTFRSKLIGTQALNNFYKLERAAGAANSSSERAEASARLAPELARPSQRRSPSTGPGAGACDRHASQSEQTSNLGTRCPSPGAPPPGTVTGPPVTCHGGVVGCPGGLALAPSGRCWKPCRKWSTSYNQPLIWKCYFPVPAALAHLASQSWNLGAVPKMVDFLISPLIWKCYFPVPAALVPIWRPKIGIWEPCRKWSIS